MHIWIFNFLNSVIYFRRWLMLSWNTLFTSTMRICSLWFSTSMNTGEILQLQCFVFVLSLYIHTYVNTPSRLHVPLKLGARNPREWKLADTLKMRFSDQLCYYFNFSTDVFWNVTFNLGKLHFFSSNWLIVVSQKPPQCIALPWMYVSWFTPSSFFYVNERPGLMGVMLFLVSPHSIT